MLIHTLAPSECREVLARARFGRLACARSDQPYVVPVSLYLDPEHNVIFGFSTVGRKVRWMRANPRVCVEVEEIVSRTDWTTVVAFGRYEEITRGPESAPLRERAAGLFGREPQWWLPGAASLASGEQHVLPVIYRIRLGRLTGRRVVPRAAARP
jgi:uncharacterized protein